MTDMQNGADAPRWSLEGLARGAWLTTPMLPSTAMVAAAFGTVAAQKGMTLVDAMVMNGVVFAGASQLVVMEIWTNPLPLAALLSISVVTAAVNMRYFLMGVALRPWLGSLPGWQVYPMLFFLADTNWIVGMRYRKEGGSDAGVFLGSSLILWVAWVAAVVPGYLLGALAADPRRYGLDVVMPVLFCAMLVPMWRGARRAIPWALAGATALVASILISGWWFIVIGAVTGSLAAGFIDEPE
jgi:predicted branched-subunit amino acid permease